MIRCDLVIHHILFEPFSATNESSVQHLVVIGLEVRYAWDVIMHNITWIFTFSSFFTTPGRLSTSLPYFESK